MSSDRQEYVKLCKDFNLKTQSLLETALAKSSTSGSLNLGGISLSTTSCQVLGKLLATSTSICKLDVSNCMLPSLGVSHLLSGLAKNTSVIQLDMSSNNLQANTAMKIGTMLRKNSTMKRLLLQWNSLGCSRDSVGLLCDGLKVNEALQELDLRNNELGPTSVTELANALSANKTLTSIDLRWNLLGPGDGRQLLSAVQNNPCLVCVQLDGNNFSADLSLAIEQAAAHNAEIVHLAQEWQTRYAQLASRSAELEQRDGQRASGVRVLLQHQGSRLTNLVKEQKAEVVRLEEQLAECRQRAELLQSLMQDKDDQIETLQQMNHLLTTDKDKDGEEVAVLRNQLEESRVQVHKLHADSQAYQAEVVSLKQQRAHLQTSFEMHNTKCTDVVKATEARALEAVQRVHKERELAEVRVQKEREQREQLELSLQEAQTQLAAQQQASVQALNTAKQQAAEHEAERISMLQATMAALLTEKNSLGSELDAQRSLVVELRREAELHRSDLQRHEDLVMQLQQEVAEERGRCSQLQAQALQASTRGSEEAAQLRAQIADVQRQLAMLQGEREEHVKQLMRLVTTQEQNIAALRMGEAERAGLLCSALTQYLSKMSPMSCAAPRN